MLSFFSLLPPPYLFMVLFLCHLKTFIFYKPEGNIATPPMSYASKRVPIDEFLAILVLLQALNICLGYVLERRPAWPWSPMPNTPMDTRQPGSVSLQAVEIKRMKMESSRISITLLSNLGRPHNSVTYVAVATLSIRKTTTNSLYK